MADESINTTATFSLDDIKQATKQSNFNKGLGPDCFDGNLLNKKCVTWRQSDVGDCRLTQQCLNS